jgi:hypothetical protein
MQIDDVMALVDEYVSASIEDHGYRSGAASAEYLEDTKRKLLAAIETLISAPAAPQQAEPVGYFQRDCDYFEQVEDVYQWDADVIPLYLHPPAAEVQRLRDAARLALDALTCGYGDDPDGTHSCGRCDSSVDRNSVARAALRRALEGK